MVGVALLLLTRAFDPAATAAADWKWEAPPECINADSFRRRLDEVEAPAGLQIEVEIERDADRYRARLRLASAGDELRRELVADECETLTDGIVLLLADWAARTTTSETPPEPERPTAGEDASIVPEPPESNAAAPPEPSPATPNEPGVDEPGDQPVVILQPPSDPPRGAAQLPGARLVLGGGARVQSQTLLAGHLCVEAAYRGRRHTIGGQVSWRSPRCYFLADEARGLDFQSVEVGPRACARGMPLPAFEWTACGNGVLTIGVARGLGERVGSSVDPGAQVGASLGGLWRVSRTIAIEARLSGSAALFRTNFDIDGVRAFDAGLLSASASLGLVWDFFSSPTPKSRASGEDGSGAEASTAIREPQPDIKRPARPL